MTSKRWLAGAAIAGYIVWNGDLGDRLHACGPFIQQMIVVNPTFPTDLDGFSRGELGVVQPRYLRQYLVVAYRRLAGVAPVGRDQSPEARPEQMTDGPRAFPRWLEALKKVPGGTLPAEGQDPTVGTRTADFSYYYVCNNDAVATAADTLNARIRQFGPSSPGVRDWVAAQTAVFANCERDPGPSVPLPAPAADNLDPIFKADRAYQTAAAHFYRGDYDEAEKLFRAIAADRTSPWQPKGRYLAARALVRRALLGGGDVHAGLAKADAELASILSDPAEASMHQAAQSLRDWVTIHQRPADRLHEAALQLMSVPAPTKQTYIDYTRLMDRLVDPQVTYDYGKLSPELAHADDLTDWITAMQGQGDAAPARAVSQWKARRTLQWLVAALWRVDPKSSDADQLISAAASLPPDSPAYITAVFLRARLLIARGDFAAARIILAATPDAPGPAVSKETINMFRALRFRSAATLDDLLQSAPRMPVGSGDSFYDMNEPGAEQLSKPTFDVDASITFTEQLPLRRLADAVRSNRLPDRLRLKVAVAAWTRAVQLRDDTAGVEVARILRSLAPAMSADLNSYVDAANAERRHHAGVLTLLRWPGMLNYVTLSEEREVYLNPQPRHFISGDAIGIEWWCSFTPSQYRGAGPYHWYKEAPLTSLPDFGNKATRSTPPEFLNAADRVAMATEWKTLSDFGSGPTYLAREAVAWARSRPGDAGVAEALARGVKATRYGCSDAGSGKASQQAFALLHKLYPQSTWAKQTPFWYDGR